MSPGTTSRVLALPLVGLVRLYRLLLSPWLGAACRFRPTCSEYAETALRRHGALYGTALAARRIARCHPWGGAGYDPVPDAPTETTPACRRERSSGNSPSR